jgi:RNA polymerase sigma factor (sigma-70 family)
MASHPVMRHVRAAGSEGAPDALLLRRFVAARDEVAFAAIVERHGPMVLGVARRAVADVHLAEDVCQATFLILVRKAASVRRASSLASWLHGVSLRLAHKARAKANRDCRPDIRPRAAVAEPADDLTWRELRRVLDEELARLPERYRLPMVLCHLEGLTRDEAATRLGCGVQQLKGMLERGRERLRARLVRRGISLSAALAGPLLAERASAIPPLLAIATLDAGMKLAAGAALAECGLSPALTQLVRVGMQTMITRLTRIAAAATVLVLLSTWLWAFPRDDKREQKPPAGNPSAAAVKWVEAKTLADVTGQVQVLAFSVDGKTLYASPGAEYLHSWRTSDWDGKRIQRAGARFAGFGANGKPMGIETALKAPDRVEVRVIDWETGTNAKKGAETANVVQAAISPDGATLAVATLKETSLIDAASGGLLAKIDHGGRPIQTLAFSGNGEHLAIGFGAFVPQAGPADGGCEIWSVGGMRRNAGPPMRMTAKYTAPESAIARLAFSPDGKLIAGVWPNGPVIYLWDANGEKRPRALKEPEGTPREPFLAAAFLPDGKTLVTNWRAHGERDEHGVALYDVETGKKVEVLRATFNKPKGGAGRTGQQLFSKPGMVISIAVSPDGKLIAAGDAEGNIKIWRRE